MIEQKNIPLNFTIAGKIYTPMSDADRKVQRRDIIARTSAVNKYLQELQDDEPDTIVEELRRCMEYTSDRPATGFLYWCEHYAFTFDPRRLTQAQSPHVRFILYPYQREAATRILRAILYGGTIVMDKSRDMGASWIMMAVITWCWLFLPSFHALTGSRKEDLVDIGTIDDLFGKIDYMIERLPPWMLNGYVKKAPDRKQMTLKHPTTGNLVTGESANKNFGRGPRKNLVYLDEFAFWEDAASVWTGIQDTAPCIIATSTPEGMSNTFARLRHTEGMPTISLHWTEHPEKDLVWYQRECDKRRIGDVYDTVAIAQELNIDYHASGGRLALPQLSSGMRERIIVNPVPVNDASHDGASFFMGLDWGTTSPSALQVYRVRRLHPTQPSYEIVSLWEYYEPSSLDKLATAIKTCPYWPRVEAVYADPSMWSMNQNSREGVTSLALLFKNQYGIHLSSGRRGDTTAIEYIRMAWRDPENPTFMISSACSNQIRELAGLRYETLTSFMENKRNPSERLVDKHNHCFVGETLVTMADGSEKFIKDVRAGDYVLTSTGSNCVIEHLPHDVPQEIFKLYLSNGKTLGATANHRIFTNKGKLTVDELKYGMIVFSQCQNISYLKAKNIGGMDDIIPPLVDVKMDEKDFMLPFGKKFMEVFQKVFRFITRTMIDTIMTLGILRCWTESLISSTMQNDLKILKLELNMRLDLLYKEKKLHDGMEVQQGKNGIVGMVKKFGRQEKRKKPFVHFVIESLKPFILPALSFVTRIVTKLTKGQNVWVIGVRPLNIKKQVYDLAVEGTHNYYANGILVSNSYDSLKYFLNSWFDAPYNITPTATPVTGWQAMNEEMKTLKMKKLRDLHRPRQGRVRFV